MYEEGDVHKRPLLRRLRWLPQENVQQLPVQFLIWLIPHRQIQPGFFVHNALVVGEGIKTVFPVVSAHTALARRDARAEATTNGLLVLRLVVQACSFRRSVVTC